MFSLAILISPLLLILLHGLLQSLYLIFARSLFNVTHFLVIGLASKTPQAYVRVDVLTFDLNLCACPKLKFKVHGEYFEDRGGREW